jgi:hypothetical protein
MLSPDRSGKSRSCGLSAAFGLACISFPVTGRKGGERSPVAIEKRAFVLSVRPPFAIFAGNHGFFGINLGKDRVAKENT